MNGLEYVDYWDKTDHFYIFFNGKSKSRTTSNEDKVEIKLMRNNQLKRYREHLSFTIKHHLNYDDFHKFILHVQESDTLVLYEKYLSTNDTDRKIIKIYNTFNQETLLDILKLILSKINSI